jgi:iron complex outermembrane recepter protein
MAIMHNLKSGAAMLSLCVAAQAVHAQTPQSDIGTEEDQSGALIIVTAQKRDTTLLETPASLGVITDENIANGFVVDTIDLTLLDPSLTIGGGRIRIRGVGTDAFDVAAEPSVSFAVDGVVLGRTGQAFLDLVDVERVEVLRGPQGTLYGKNVSAGLVNVVTKAPARSFEADAEFIAIEQGEYQAKASLSGPISDRFRVRLSGTYKSIDGFLRNGITGRKTNGDESWTIRGKAAFDVSSDVEAVLTAWTRRGDRDGPNESFRLVTDPAVAAAIRPVIAGIKNRDVATDGTSFSRLNESGGIFELSWRPSDGPSLQSFTSYIRTKARNSDDVDGRPDLTPLYSGGITPLGTAGPIIFKQDNDQRITQYSQELRLTSPDGPVQYVAGLYGFKLKLEDTLTRAFDVCVPTGLNFLPTLPPGSPCFDPALLLGRPPGIIPASVAFGPGSGNAQVDRVVNTETAAAFGQVDVLVASALTLTGGLRLQYDKTSFVVSQPFPSSALLGFGPNVGPTRGSTKSSALSGKFAARYELAPNANAYMSYTKGYKSPTASLQGAVVGRVDAETSNAFEAGIKADLIGGRFFVQAAGFWTDYDNFQTEAFSPASASFVLTNAGKTRTRGVEISFNAKASEHLSVFGGFAYTEATIRDFKVGQCFSPTVLDPRCVTQIVGGQVFQFADLSGGDLPNSPDLKFNITARYETPISESLKIFGQAGYVWQDDIQFDLSQNPNTIQRAYGLLDLSAGFATANDRVQLTFFVKNALDQNWNSFIFQDFIQRDSVNILQFFDKRSSRLFGGSLRFSF